jgi:hypothetical protein
VLAVIAATAGRDCGHRIVMRREENLFRFPSVASKPRFSHDPVNLAPDCNG